LVPIDDLVVTRGFTQRPEDYKNAKIQPHLVVNRKRAEREPGSEHQMGDRIPYVLARTPEMMNKRLRSEVKGWMCAEDPDYVRQTQMPIYFEHYLEKMIRKPMTRIFDSIYWEGFTEGALFSPQQVMVTAKPINGAIQRAFGFKPDQSGPLVPIAATATAKPIKRLNVDALVTRFKSKPVQSKLTFGPARSAAPTPMAVDAQPIVQPPTASVGSTKRLHTGRDDDDDDAAAPMATIIRPSPLDQLGLFGAPLPQAMADDDNAPRIKRRAPDSD
jgi:hypothetical protein